MNFKLTDAFTIGTRPAGFGRCRFANSKGNGVVLGVLLVTTLFWCGCHKKKEVKPPPAEATPAPVTTTAAPPPPATAPRGPVAQALPATSQTIAANSKTEEVTGQLSMELRRYVAYTHTIPKNFEDFIAHDPVKFPPPPTGKKYVILGGWVVVQ